MTALAVVLAGTSVVAAACTSTSTAPVTMTVTSQVTVTSTETSTATATATEHVTVTTTASPVTVTMTSAPVATPPPAPPETLSGDDLIVAAAAAAAKAGVEPADPDAPGPDSGPACAADPNYYDEAPTGLRADMIIAWKKVVSAAAEQGITLCINDGKRSRAQQQAVYDEYVQLYGEATADSLVLPPKKSAHVVGLAVDVQPAAGYQWLQDSNGEWGFCRIYDNEAWHFEFNPNYPTTGCPQRLPEPQR